MRRLGVRGDVARQVRRALVYLEHAPKLPGPGDVYKLIADPDDPIGIPKLAHARRVPGHGGGRNLWVWYWPVSNALVRVVALDDQPP